MSKREQTSAHILEILHPVLLAALVGPAIYCLFKSRVNAWVTSMYLLGFWLLPLSAVVRIAGRRIHNLFAFLAVSAVVFAAVFLAGTGLARMLWSAGAVAGTGSATSAGAAGAASVAGAASAAADALGAGSAGVANAGLVAGAGSAGVASAGLVAGAGSAGAASADAAGTAVASVSTVPIVIYTLEMLVGGLWIILGTVGLRLRENRRVRARLENDLTWQEKSILAEKPAAPCLILFVVVYLEGLLNACPPLCNIAVGSGLVYLAIVLVYRSIEVMRAYMKETQSLSNVPAKKISGIRYRFLAAALGVLCVVAIVAFGTARFRTYRDLRYWELKGQRIEWENNVYETQPSNFEVYDEEFGLGIEEHTDPPQWLVAFEEMAAIVLPLALAVFLLFRIWRSLTQTAKEFSEIQEENGDIAVRLDDASDEIRDLGPGRLRRFMRGESLTEKEKIRREYRRAIRRYRGEAPLRSETPSEIERGARFPQEFDIEALHEKYEKARYGK